MEYFKILNFSKEPFSNSPDPEAFFQSRQHVGCLQKLELAIRMRRGLNVVIGDVGTGKTTLCRQLIRQIGDDEKIESHLILDPNFSSDSEFLHAVARIFLGRKASASASDWQLKEEIKQYLFNCGVAENKIIVLIIDEGQKIPEFCLETLREFLNYETNDSKLLQIVIFAQKEFTAKIEARQNFADRINLYHTLNPLNFQETRAMIRYRLDLASTGTKGSALFSMPAHWVVYRATRGFPRKIINLCHRIILAMIIQNRNRAGFFLALSSVKRVFPEQVKRWKLAGTGMLAAAIALLVLISIAPQHIFSAAFLHKPERHGLSPVEKMAAEALLTDATAKEEAGAKTEGEAGHNSLAPQYVFSTASMQQPQGKQLAPVEKTAAGVPLPYSAAKEEKGVKTDGEMGHISIAAAALEEAEKTVEGVYLVPEILGKVNVSGEETLSRMIYLVYGPLSSFKEKNMETFLMANPQIRDPDLLQPGDVITFPVVQLEMQSLPPETWRIELTRKNTLEEAYDAMLRYSSLENKTRLFPLPNDTGGIQFVIVVRKGFPSWDAAWEELQRMPAAVTAEADVVSNLSLGQSLLQFAGQRESKE